MYRQCKPLFIWYIRLEINVKNDCVLWAPHVQNITMITFRLMMISCLLSLPSVDTLPEDFDTYRAQQVQLQL